MEQLFCEKYRPKTINDCILPEKLKKTFQEIVNQNNLNNLLLCGTAGLGKTTVAKALCNELGYDYLLINCSEDNGIDTLRNKIRNFASTVSLKSDSLKVVILDEFDYAQANSFQPSLRGFIEEFSNNCRFILTANFKQRIIEPIHSRCSVVEFNTTKKELATLSKKFLKRLKQILTEENIQYDEKILADLIIKHSPDWRRILNECQRYSYSGKINSDILTESSGSNEQLEKLISELKNKNFKNLRKWVANNAEVNSGTIYNHLYYSLYEICENDNSKIPEIVLIIAKYAYQQSFSVDPEINMMACLTEIMLTI